MGISQKYGPNECFSHIYIPFIRLKTPPGHRQAPSSISTVPEKSVSTMAHKAWI